MNTPYNLNSPTLPPVRKYPMDITRLLQGNEYLKKVIDSCKDIDQCYLALNFISTWLGNIEVQNKIRPRLKFIDYTEFFFRGRYKERKRYLGMCALICQELQDTLSTKMSEFIDEDGEVKKITQTQVVGFKH